MILKHILQVIHMLKISKLKVFCIQHRHPLQFILEKRNRSFIVFLRELMQEICFRFFVHLYVHWVMLFAQSATSAVNFVQSHNRQIGWQGVALGPLATWLSSRVIYIETNPNESSAEIQTARSKQCYVESLGQKHENRATNRNS